VFLALCTHAHISLASVKPRQLAIYSASSQTCKLCAPRGVTSQYSIRIHVIMIQFTVKVLIFKVLTVARSLVTSRRNGTIRLCPAQTDMYLTVCTSSHRAVNYISVFNIQCGAYGVQQCNSGILKRGTILITHIYVAYGNFKCTF